MKIKSLFSIIIIFLSLISVNQWSILPIGNLWFEWILKIVLIIAIIRYKKYLFPIDEGYSLLNLYLYWIAFCLLRGLFISENYLEYRQLIDNGLTLFIPLLLFLFCRPDVTQYIFRNWYKWGMFSFFVFILWVCGPTQFFLSPLLILFCFFSLQKRRWATLIFFMGIIYTLIDAENARAQFIKGGFSLLVGISILFVDKISVKLVRFGHIIGYLSTFLLFGFILSDASGLILGEISEDDAIYNHKHRETLSKDTRSLIYYDVFNSAFIHNYWLCGHTPARGNEIGISFMLFEHGYDGKHIFNKNERARNEMLHANIFTWTGLIGLVIYALLYMRPTYLAVYKSRNDYLPILACFVAFRWSFGWIEDTNRFLISDIDLWAMIAMCYSPLFRNMTNKEFKYWVRGLIK